MKRNSMKVLRGEGDDMFTEYVFFHGGYEEHRRYLNVRLRNRVEELLNDVFGNCRKIHVNQNKFFFK